MTVPNWVAELRTGDVIEVRHGRSGTQWAIVTRKLVDGFLYVRKWKPNSNTWTRRGVAIPSIDVKQRVVPSTLPNVAFDRLILLPEYAQARPWAAGAQ